MLYNSYTYKVCVPFPYTDATHKPNWTDYKNLRFMDRIYIVTGLSYLKCATKCCFLIIILLNRT